MWKFGQKGGKMRVGSTLTRLLGNYAKTAAQEIDS